MKNYIIFYNEKEGTNALIRLLDNFEQTSIVRQAKEWEPFDQHAYGKLSQGKLMRCLDLVFSNSPSDFEELNNIYTQTARAPIQNFDRNKAVGFKMRFYAPWRTLKIRKLIFMFRTLFDFVNNYYEQSYRNELLRILKKNNVVAYVVVRQDILRWALSRYHGDGSGQPGHLQFKLANGEISREDIAKLEVNIDALKQNIKVCKRLLHRKRNLVKYLNTANIPTYPIMYEDFLTDKHSYFKQFFQKIGIDVSEEEIDSALDKGAYFEKVHSNDISKFVINHEEVLAKLGDQFEPW